MTPEKIGKLQEVLDVRFEVPKHSNLLKLRSRCSFAQKTLAAESTQSTISQAQTTPQVQPRTKTLWRLVTKVREIFLGLVGPSKTPRSCGLLPVSMVAPMSERWIMNLRPGVDDES